MALEPIDYWRLCDELTVIQAAALVVDVDPSGEVGAYCEDWKLHERPTGYEAAKSGIARALQRGIVRGLVVPLGEYDMNGNQCGEIAGSVDLEQSTVEVDSLRSWLRGLGFMSAFFFPPESRAPDFANRDSPYYAPDLAAAMAAWEAVSGDPTLLRGKKPKQAIVAWLKKNGDRYGLIDDDGNPRENRMNEIATLANWDKTPGAAKTPDSPPDS